MPGRSSSHVWDCLRGLLLLPRRADCALHTTGRRTEFLFSSGFRRPNFVSASAQPGNGSDCCLWAGIDSGCQGVKSCKQHAAQPPCGSGLPPGPAPPPAQKGLNVQQMRDIKAALQGKTVRADGTVDHSSQATTPHLKLFAVTYHNQLQTLGESKVLIDDGYLDGISFWIGGPAQREISANLTSLVAELRAIVPRDFPVFTGGYITYSSIGWTEPAPFYDLLRQSVDMYDDGRVQGFFLFAGSVLKSMNSSLWQKWDLPGHLEMDYFPHLGTATVAVTTDGHELNVANATATVVYGSATHVTRKAVGADGSFTFGGWVGKKTKTPHTVTVAAAGYRTASAAVQLEAGKTVRATVEVQRL